jgi:hypothetical protein
MKFDFPPALRFRISDISFTNLLRLLHAPPHRRPLGSCAPPRIRATAGDADGALEDRACTLPGEFVGEMEGLP